MKTVFKSSELPHIWAHQSAPTGRCSANESFDGILYFSYATPIAALVKGRGGVAGVVLNSTSYSPSTSNHQRGVRAAVNHIEHQFHVYGIPRGERWAIPTTGKELRDCYLLEFERKLPQSRYAHVRACDFLRRVSHLKNAIRACEFFGMAHKSLDLKLAKLASEIEAAEAVARDRAAKSEQRAREIAERRVAGAVRSATAWLSDDRDTRTFGSLHLLESDPGLQDRVQQKNNKLSAEVIQRWKAGDQYVQIPNSVDTQLRKLIDSDEIQTSHGAIFPYEHGRRAYLLVKAIHGRGEAFHSNGHTIKVGNYQIDSIDESGTIHAGCHHIPWGVVEEFAQQEGWGK